MPKLPPREGGVCTAEKTALTSIPTLSHVDSKTLLDPCRLALRTLQPLGQDVRAVFADNPFVLSLCLPGFESHFSLESGAGIALAMLIGFSKM